MKNVTLIPALITSFGLAACGGSTTSNDGGVVQQGKFGGTTSVSQPSNNAFFANSSSNVFDLRGETLTLKTVELYATASGTTLQIDSEAVTFSPVASGTSLRASSITIDGQIYPIGSNNQIVANGIPLDISFDDEGNVYLQPGGFGGSQGTNLHAGFGIVGLETSPANMPASGTASYSGEFTGAGVIELDGTRAGGFSMDSDITIGANFSAGTVSGNLTNGTISYFDGTSTIDDQFTGSFANLAVTGNGYEGDLVFQCGSGFTCTDSSEVGGVFYGPSAQETGGIAILDFTRTNNSSNEFFELEGIGGFVAK